MDAAWLAEITPHTNDVFDYWCPCDYHYHFHAIQSPVDGTARCSCCHAEIFDAHDGTSRWKRTAFVIQEEPV